MEPKNEILEWKLFQNMLLCRMKQKLVATYSCGGDLLEKVFYKKICKHNPCPYRGDGTVFYGKQQYLPQAVADEP